MGQSQSHVDNVPKALSTPFWVSYFLGSLWLHSFCTAHGCSASTSLLFRLVFLTFYFPEPQVCAAASLLHAGARIHSLTHFVPVIIIPSM